MGIEHIREGKEKDVTCFAILLVLVFFVNYLSTEYSQENKENKLTDAAENN